MKKNDLCPQCHSPLTDAEPNSYYIKTCSTCRFGFTSEDLRRAQRNEEKKMKEQTLKKTILFALAGMLLLGGLLTYQCVAGRYRFEKNYLQLWNLADKSSTIVAKEQYISQFAAKLTAGYNGGDFASHNAIFLETPDNEFLNNH